MPDCLNCYRLELEGKLKAREIELLKEENAKLRECLEKMNQLCIRAQASAERALDSAEHWLHEAEKQQEAKCARG